MAPLTVLGCLWVATGLAVLALGVRDLRRRGEASRLTAALLWPWHGINYALTTTAALQRPWPIEIPLAAGVGSGGLLLLAGLAAIAAGFYEFRSEERLTGMRHDELITTGVYRYSRHPQYAGIALTLIGIALIGRSGAALAIAAGLIAVFACYLPFEERFVERVFGDRYRRYREATPMLLGRPRVRPRPGAGPGSPP